MKKTSILILFCFFIVPSYAQKQVKEYDELMLEVFSDNGPGAVALIIEDDKTLYRKAFGKQKRAG